MNNKKQWLLGPFKSNFPVCNPVHFQPPIDKPVKKIQPLERSNIPYVKKTTPKNVSKPPWREAGNKSRELFIYETNKLTII
jgi:hypothetical protein